MLPMGRPRTSGIPTSILTLIDRELWMRAAPVNHRFDKLGNALPLELHGCGCSLCARQQRALRKFFSTGSPRSHGEASDFVGDVWAR